MSRIPVPAIEHVPAESQALLAGVKSRLGTVPNMYRIIANSPAALEAFLGFHSALDKGGVDQLTRERIALAVAEANGSDYCLSARTHRVRKAAMLDDAEITANRSGASNDIRADAAVRFAAKLARERGQASDADIEAIQRAGYSDAEIVEVIANVAINVFANMINEALKTDIDFPQVGTRKAT
jgi:uncharacterized peroxidase-related enzyme